MEKLCVMRVMYPSENKYIDFEVCYVNEGETDEEAIKRARKYYKRGNEFYIKQVDKNDY